MSLSLDLDEVFARNRLLFGDIRMEADDDKANGDAADDGTDDANADGDKPDSDGDGGDDAGTDSADALGDAGKQALDRMKARLKREREARTKAEKALADASKSDDDKPDLDKIREEARNEAKNETLRERVMDKIEAKAGSRFAIDSEDVAALLMRRHELDDFLDDGKVDIEAITEALDDLLAKQPRLAVTQGDEKKFKGSADAGAQGKAGKPQLTREDVQRLSREGKHSEIEQARLDGRLNQILDIK